MAIDNCDYSFATLAGRVLPRHMVRMKKAMEAPLDMSLCGTKGAGPKTILKRVGRSEDFSGCYVFIDDSNPIYVGISRMVIQRILQQVKGRTHFDASLAYRMASKRHPHATKRQLAMSLPDFQQAFEEAKNYLKSLKVAFIEIQNDIEMHLFEAYCAIELNTSEWNTFRTH